MDTKNRQALERIQALVDPDSFVELGASVAQRSTDFVNEDWASSGDGVITGYATVGEKLVYLYSQDAAVLNGSLGEMHAEKIAHVYEMAMKMGAPVVGLLDCSGIRLQESVDALQGFGRLYELKTQASGIVPQISVVFGNCGGGMAVLCGMSDFVYMEENGRLFVNAPNTLAGNSTEKCDSANAEFQACNTGLVDGFGSQEEIMAAVRELLSFLPENNEGSAIVESTDDLNRLTSELENVTDAESIIKVIADGYKFVETKANYGTCVKTGFIRLDGITVGVIANAETYICADACDKAAEFVNFCDAFEIPVLTLTNIEGFEATLYNEKHIAKAAARLVYAFANASVPKINVVLKGYATSYLMMNSKAIGADVVLALENAEIGMMDGALAAKIIGGEDLKAVEEKFNEKQTALASARRGYVDRLVNMTSLRKEILVALEMLFQKRVDAPFKKHGTK